MSNMGRPGKRRGEVGEVRYKANFKPGSTRAVSYTASVSVGDADGESRNVRRTAPTKKEASDLVTAAVENRKRLTGAHHGIDGNTTIGELVELFLEDLPRDTDLLPQSKERYVFVAREIQKTWLALPVMDLDGGSVAVHVKKLERKSASRARLTLTVLRRVLEPALLASAVPVNAAWITGIKLKVPKKDPRAMSVAEIQLLFRLISEWKSQQPKSGPKKTDDLADLVSIMLATGCRIGEALALRRTDVYMEDEKVFIDISGTIVYSKGAGTSRQGKTKNGASASQVRLTSSAATAVRRRALEREHELLFSTRTGGPLQQQNLGKHLRAVVAGTELEWLTSHVFRKTSGTAIYLAKGIHATQKHLRHLNLRTTEGVYVDKSKDVAEDHTDALEQLAVQTD
jgi:integrase